MLSFPSSLKNFVAVEQCALRCGHNGLLALGERRSGRTIKCSAPFVFTNKRRGLL